MIHAWCRDVARDEAVRAAEDGRTGPLPTLKECIYGMFPKSGSATSPVEHENKGDGMATDGLRTERITLEVRHGESFGVSHWSWVTILRLQSGESVRVVEDPAQAASGGGEQPRGWLTGEEREMIAGITDDDDYTEEGQDIAKGLLARSTPPEVVKPSRSSYAVSSQYAHGWDECDRAYRAALAAAGVAVKEVGRE